MADEQNTDNTQASSVGGVAGMVLGDTSPAPFNFAKSILNDDQRKALQGLDITMFAIVKGKA